jgi:hypothetical protein
MSEADRPTAAVARRRPVSREGKGWAMSARALRCAAIAGGLSVFGSSWAQGFDVLISRNYVRAKGEPVAVTDSFTVCDTAGQFTLAVENGPGGEPRVSSGTVLVNGLEVIRDADLGQQVGRLERPLSGVLRTNRLDVRLGSQPGGTLIVSILGLQSCGGVRITAPAPGSTVREPAIVVEGELSPSFATALSLTVGVTIEGRLIEVPVPVHVNDRRFAGWVPLAPGEVRLVARATEGTGRITEDSVTLTVVLDSPDERAIPPEASPTVGFAPLTVTFRGSAAADPTVTALDLDADGDGRPDFTLTDFLPPPHEVPYAYQTEGLYVATAVIHDQAGQSRTARVPINVIPVPDLPGLWDAFRTSLAQGDVDAALELVALEARERYRRVLEDLRADLAAIAAALGGVTLHVVTPEYATASIAHVRDGVSGSFLIHFVRDGDGVWRVASL